MKVLSIPEYKCAECLEPYAYELVDEVDCVKVKFIHPVYSTKCSKYDFEFMRPLSNYSVEVAADAS